MRGREKIDCWNKLSCSLAGLPWGCLDLRLMNKYKGFLMTVCERFARITRHPAVTAWLFGLWLGWPNTFPSTEHIRTWLKHYRTLLVKTRTFGVVWLGKTPRHHISPGLFISRHSIPSSDRDAIYLLRVSVTCFQTKPFSQAELKEAADHNLSEKGSGVNTTMSGMNRQSATLICRQGKIEMQLYFCSSSLNEQWKR